MDNVNKKLEKICRKIIKLKNKNQTQQQKYKMPNLQRNLKEKKSDQNHKKNNIYEEIKTV